jgi:Tfp pilus assembly protein PilN
MPLADINLLAKQQTTVSRLNQANFVVAVVAGVIIGLQLLIVVFLFSTIGIRTAEKNNAQAQTDDYKAQIAEKNKQTPEGTLYPSLDLSQQALAYQSQVDILGRLIDNHRYFSLYISEIAQNTPPEVYYRTFASDTPGKLAITGNAKAYGDVAKLAERFKNLSFAKDVQIQDAKSTTAAATVPGATSSQNAFPVTFSITIEMKSAAELNKLPGPIPKTGQSAASPAPRPSSSPVSLPSPGATR